jgi:polysaccharide deacetylase family sporulation protein PdaB
MYQKGKLEVIAMKKYIGKIIKNRRLLGGAALIIIVVLIFWAVNNPAFVGASATTRLLPIYSVERDNKCVCLTFDAAWGNEDTQTLIDILGTYNVKATFFVVGSWVDKYPESVKALHDAGHEVMNHSNDHAHFSKLTKAEIVENINACNDKIEQVTGVRPFLFRAPYGEYDDNVVGTLTEMEMYTIQWDCDSLDWKDLPADEIKERVLSKVAPGSIVLFHNAALHTPEALPGIIEGLLADGYTIIPVSEMILRENYYMDHTGRQTPQKRS